MLETCGGGFCMKKHPSVEVTLFGNWLPFWEIPAGMGIVRAEKHRNTGRIHTCVNECSEVHAIMTLSHCLCLHHRDHTLPCWSPIEWRNGYCHCVWGFYSMIVVCIDYIEHTNVVSVQLSHFQVCIGTCKFFHFAFSGLTSNIDALTKLQYALSNTGYQTHILCL